MKNKFIIAGLLTYSLSLSAEGIETILGVEIGASSLSDSYIDYDAATLRATAGIAQQKKSVKGILKLYVQASKGEIDEAGYKYDADSVEAGIAYELMFGSSNWKPLIGVEIGKGNTDFEVGSDESYTAYSGYAGVAYTLSNDMELTGNLGYRGMSYDDSDVDFKGVDFRIGLNFLF